MVQRVLAGHPSHLSTYGFGPRKGLLLHCSLAHGGVYSKLGAAIGGAFSLTSFDQPGHGRAADWDDKGDMQDRVTEMALDLLTEPMDVIGHSFGGTVALRLAVERPEMVRSLILIEPVMMAIAKADNPKAVDVLKQEMGPFYQALQDGELELATRLFTETYGDGRPWDSLPIEGRKALARRIHLIGANSRGVNEDHYNLIASRKLEQISAPTLVMDGCQGGPVMEGVCAGLAKRIANTTWVRISDGGHMVPLTRPEAVAREILQFISQQQG
ncbi:MAG: alpha/beta hydrolase [Planktotalea sp.]|uniref:alpha/beta fold hydrolase n=1 Tax=Planktotalea sp. TaxID=2029877 RepID=UPI003C717AA2